jgi:hypothetical protein
VDISKGRPLSDRSYDKFQDKLRNLTTPSKNKIKETMAFALDYADCSGDVVDLLEGSILVKEANVNVKVKMVVLVFLILLLLLLLLLLPFF